MSARHSIDIPTIAEFLAQKADSVASYLFPNGTKEGHYWVIGDIQGNPGKSLKIKISGDKVGRWRDYSDPVLGGDLVELWALNRGQKKRDALREIKSYLGLQLGSAVPTPKPTPPVVAEAPVEPTTKVEQATKPVRRINRDYHQQLRTNLAKNPAALEYLAGEKRGLTKATLDHFGLGLSSDYIRSDGTVTSAAIVAPMRSPTSGLFLNKSAYITIPGVTQNPTAPNGWMKGAPQCYFADIISKQRILFVCEGLKDVWRHWQGLAQANLDKDILLISSTHGSAIPAEWEDADFWAKWSAVYLAQDNDEAGDKIAERVLEFVGREARRIRVPADLGKDWTDFWQNGGTIEYFKELLDEAPVASVAISVVEPKHSVLDGPPRIGRFSHRPVDINGAYVNGHLYYPTETHVIRRDEETGMMVERVETMVVRSDRTTHTAFYAPAPPGTPLHKRILKLSDGTVIVKEPRASTHHTWDFEAILAYLNGKNRPRSLAVLVREAQAILKQAVWLPYEEDYVTLAMTVPVTYLQSVFEAVPLLLLNGEAGSGKSQTGATMARLCANGMVVGQGTAASTARLIDETRGFVVLDDVESIASKAGKDAQINELVQALKVSYNKSTAVKYWTDIKTMKVEPLNFYGVKLLNNTHGADSILETRMLRIKTRKMPPDMASNVRDFSPEDLIALRNLRNEFHTWAFEAVGDVAKCYREVYDKKTDRQDEIAAPLRTIARLVNDPELTAMLEASLARQHLSQSAAYQDDPVATLKEAVRNLIRQGFDTVTVTHIRLEMRALLDANYGMSHTTEIPEWDRPEWLGRQLRSNDLIVESDIGRKRVYGKNLRLVQFSDWILKSTALVQDSEGNAITLRPTKKPEDFCQGCQSCPYRMAGCELQELRTRDESSRGARLKH